MTLRQAQGFKDEKNNIMNTQQQMEERLWSYIDGVSEADEKSAIDQLLQSNVE